MISVNDGNIQIDKHGNVPLIASIDVGTTSSRVIFFNKQGQEVAKHQIEYSTSASNDKFAVHGSRRQSIKDHSEEAIRAKKDKPVFTAEGIAIKENKFLTIEELHGVNEGPTLKFPKPGWVECDPINVLINVIQCLGSTYALLDKLNIERAKNNLPLYRVDCAGVANMRETTIVWSKKTGMPIVDYGIVWNDTRTLDLVQKKKKETPKEKRTSLKNKTGLSVFSTYFSCSKLKWLLENEPKVQKAYEEGDLMFGTVDTWLIYHLTDRKAFVSDVTNASRTGFMNLDTRDYDDELVEFWGIDKNLINFPKIVSSAEYYGDLTVPPMFKNQMEEEVWDLLQKYTNEEYPIPIQGCLGDQSASLVGQMAFKPGAAKCTYGTGCFLLYNTGCKKLISKHGALTTFSYWFPYLSEKDHEEYGAPHFALEGSVAVAGAVVQWLRDNLRLIPKAEDVGPIANSVPDSGGVVFVPAFSGLFAPYWDPEARGTIMGMSQYTTASHIARAAVEAVCFQARAILLAMSNDAKGEAKKDAVFKSEIEEEGSYEKSLLSTLAVDGGMSRSDEVMQIQADILGPCVKVRRSPTAECTALGAAVAANMAYEQPKDRVLWKDLQDAKNWVFYGGLTKREFNASEHSELRVFESQSTDEHRQKHWIQWEAAVKRSKGWLKDVKGEHPVVV
ncbi:Glycerol kinase [Nakaseomyces bracarensis]|uniref:glycerol kinase n=1 Tax=Nakaseomyces bracarensis TaxID=273131 RepID=A0ABR4NTH5_9SACH